MRPTVYVLAKFPTGSSLNIATESVMNDRPGSAARDPSRDPDARLESVGQADPALREGPVSRGRLIFIMIGVSVVLVGMVCALAGTH
jgi:hypothetical protein